MTSFVALCADMASLQHPEAIGLGGESLASQEWLRLFSSGEEARRFLREDRLVDEVWVASCDDVAPVNLAAALKRDRTDRRVCLLAFEGTGSLMSRASAAGIDMSFTRQAFVDRYAQRKRQAGGSGCCVMQSSQGVRMQEVGTARGAAGQQEMRAAQGPAPQGAGRPWGAGAAPSVPSGVAAVSPTPQMRYAQGGGMGGAAVSHPPIHVGAPTAYVPSTPHDPHQAVARVQPCPQSAGASSPSARGKTAFLLPVVSGSGGAGKSTISVLAAYLGQALGYKTLLIDFDLQFGDVATMAGVQTPLTIDDVLAAPNRIEQLRSDGPRPAVLAAPRRLEDAEAVVAQASHLLEQLSSRFEFIVANTGAAWAEQHAVLLERASKALFLVDQRPSSLRACQHALDLCARCGIASGPFMFALNRCVKGAPFTSIDVSCALQGAHVVELVDGGRDVEELMGAGLPLELLESRNELCSSLEGLLLDVLPRGAKVPPREEAGASRMPMLKLGRGRKPRRRRREAACL